MFDTISALILIGIILVLGFIGNFIFQKTRIPSIVWLLFLGLLVGLIFNIQNTIHPTLLITFSEFFSAIAIVIILFDAGINTDVYQLFKGAPRGLLLTICGFVLSLVVGTLVVVVLGVFNILPLSFGDSVIVGVILGAIIGGTSGPIVIPLVTRLNFLKDKTKTMLSIESIMTDILCFVVVLALVYMISSGGGVNLGEGARNLVSTFSVGAMVGFFLGFVWLPVMHRMRTEEFSYILTLAIVFLVYALTVLLVGVAEGGTGAGAIACIVFGLVLGNGNKFLKMMNYSGEGYEMDVQTKQTHSLISFVIRTFFFVFLGIMVSFQRLEFIVIGIALFLCLFAARFLVVKFSTFKGDFDTDNKDTIAVMMPRGLAATILALNFGPVIVDQLMPGMDGFFTDVTFVVILSTAILCTVGVSLISRRNTNRVLLEQYLKSEHDKTDEVVSDSSDLGSIQPPDQ